MRPAEHEHAGCDRTMRVTRIRSRRTSPDRRNAFAPLVLALLLASGLATAGHAAEPDAEILVWHQGWHLNPDGTVTLTEKQHVRFNNERAFGDLADPRITYNVDTDKLELLVARTRLPDGTYRELPSYGRVEVAPGGVAGWPAFAGLRQAVLVMPGLEPGAVTEVEYRLTRSADAARYLVADVRLDHRYPVRERRVEVGMLRHAKIEPQVVNLPSDQYRTSVRSEGERVIWTLEAGPLPENPDEPQCPPWYERCPRLALSSAGDGHAFIHDRLADMDGLAGAVDDDLRAAATTWTAGLTDPQARLRALQEKLAATFSVVDMPAAWRTGKLRSAAECLRSGYGLPDEAALTLLALARAVGLDAQPAIVTTDAAWLAAAGQDSMVGAFIVTLAGDRDGLGWDPRYGRVARDGRWFGASVRGPSSIAAGAGALPAWNDPDESRLVCSGSIKIGADGNYSGALVIRLTGLFVTSEALRAEGAQKSRLQAIAKRVLPDVQVESFVVRELSTGRFEAELKVKSAAALPRLGGAWRFCWPADAPFGADVPLPLAASTRRLPVRLVGACTEQIDLAIEWPEGWEASITPRALPAVSRPWGSVEQGVTLEPARLRLSRTVRLAERVMSPATFGEVRGAINALRGESARLLVVGGK